MRSGITKNSISPRVRRNGPSDPGGHASLGRGKAASRGNATRRPFANNARLTDYQRRQVERRRKLLTAYIALSRNGRTQAEAAVRVGASVVSLWRWQQRLVPQTNRCGRRSVLDLFNIPERLLQIVRALRGSGVPCAAAWKEAAEYPICPRSVRLLLKRAKTIPPSLAKATDPGKSCKRSR